MKKRVIVLALALATVAGLTLSGCSGGSAGPTAKPTTSVADLGLLNSPNLKIGIMSNAEPYTYITASGKTEGFDVDLMRAVTKRAGLTPQFVAMDFSALLPSVEDGNLDVAAASISRTAQRLQSVDFSIPYYVGYMALMTLPDSKITKSESSLSDQRIGVIQGSLQDTYATANWPKAQIVRFPDNNTGVAALTAGSIAGFFTDATAVTTYQKSQPSADFKTALSIPVSQFPAAVAFKKGTSKKLQAVINTELRAVIADGTWTKIYKKYFPGQPVPSQFKATKK